MSRIQLFVITSAAGLLLFVLDLVRRRRLREEYSWLWLFSSLIYLMVAVSPFFSRLVARLIGTTNSVQAFSFLGFLFLVLISIQYSVVLSRLTTRIKNLAQHVAILDGEIQRLSAVSVDQNRPALAEKGVVGAGEYRVQRVNPATGDKVIPASSG